MEQSIYEKYFANPQKKDLLKNRAYRESVMQMFLDCTVIDYYHTVAKYFRNPEEAEQILQNLLQYYPVMAERNKEAFPDSDWIIFQKEQEFITVGNMLYHAYIVMTVYNIPCELRIKKIAVMTAYSLMILPFQEYAVTQNIRTPEKIASDFLEDDTDPFDCFYEDESNYLPF